MTFKLFGRLANITSEAPDMTFYSTELFKRLTGGDRITADKKFKDTIDFENSAKLISGANKTPKIYQDQEEGAYWERWNIIEHKVKFVDNPKDRDSGNILYRQKIPNIEKSIVTANEMSGLFNLISKLLLPTLRREMRFTHQLSNREVENLYTKYGNTPKLFLEERCNVELSNSTDAHEMYKSYEEFCIKRLKQAPVTSTKFTQELGKRGYEKIHTGNGVYIYRGLTLKEGNITDELFEDNKITEDNITITELLDEYSKKLTGTESEIYKKWCLQILVA